MPDETEQNLLDSIPTGDVIKDLREGEHYDAKLEDVELIAQSNGHALRVTYGGLRDADGRDFTFQERYTIPTSQSEDFIQRLFLNAAHAWGVVPQGDSRRVLADNEEVRNKIFFAVQSVKGASTPLRLRTDPKTGYLRSSFIKRK